MSGLRPVTVITGASAGIGAALARVLRAKAMPWRWCAAEDRLRALADEIAVAGGIRPSIVVDLNHDPPT